MITTGFTGLPPYSKPSYSSINGVCGVEAAGASTHDDHQLNMDPPRLARTLATRQATCWFRARATGGGAKRDVGPQRVKFAITTAILKLDPT
jgi:hypothetical protein